MPSLYSRLLCTVTLVICLGLVVGNASAADSDPDGRLFQPSVDALSDVQQALGRAGDDGRLALVVLGANWCHDSRALASRLHRSPLAELIQQHYELVFVDVGFYEKGRSVTQQFDASWDELHDFRVAIPKDIRELRDEAQRRVSEGDRDIQLLFPEYPLLSWESEPDQAVTFVCSMGVGAEPDILTSNAKKSSADNGLLKM